MAGELNSVQESIKLALDAADAATDVTSEYSQVKREHKKLEKKVSQIHRYTSITFVTIAAGKAATDELKSTFLSQSKSTTNNMKVSLSSIESSLQKTLDAMNQRIASNETLNGVASSQQMTTKEIKALKMQSAEIRNLLEVQQNRITFP